jgi:hypothetical protein
MPKCTLSELFLGDTEAADAVYVLHLPASRFGIFYSPGL